MLTREAKQIASIAYLLAPRVSTKDCLKPMKNATFQALLDSLPAISALFAIAEIQQVLPRVGCLYKVYSNPKYVASINQANKWALFYAHCSTQPHPPHPPASIRHLGPCCDLALNFTSCCLFVLFIMFLSPSCGPSRLPQGDLQNIKYNNTQ